MKSTGSFGITVDIDSIDWEFSVFSVRFTC